MLGEFPGLEGLALGLLLAGAVVDAACGTICADALEGVAEHSNGIFFLVAKNLCISLSVYANYVHALCFQFHSKDVARRVPIPNQIAHWGKVGIKDIPLHYSGLIAIGEKGLLQAYQKTRLPLRLNFQDCCLNIIFISFGALGVRLRIF